MAASSESQVFVLFDLMDFRFFSPSNSSMIRSHRASTSFNAIQLMTMIFNPLESASIESITELTRAVLPDPGEPEMYKLRGPSQVEDSRKLVMNSSRTVRSVSRPGRE